MTVEALTEFMLAQGPSKNTNLMEWDKLWAINKQIIDPICERYTAVSTIKLSKIEVINLPEEFTSFEVPLHPKEPLGNKIIY